MQALVMIVICAATLADYATAELALPGALKFVPEMLSCIVAALVLFEGIRKGFALVATKYWLVFGLATFIIVCGILTNSVGTGPILAGMRYYLRAIPLFLLPAVARFSDEQLRRQLNLLLGIGLLQIPFACYQRYIIWYQGRFSGDDVVGTVMESGVLSIMLICMVLVLTGFFVQKRISRMRYIGLFLLLLLPTMINETKATVILLPIGLITATVVAAPPKKRLRVFGMGVSLLVVFGAILIPVYDFMAQKDPYKNEQHLTDFFTSQKEIDRYMEAKKPAGVGTQTEVRRGDAIRVPLEYLARDPVRLAFGLGIGNASHSSIGENFTGQYFNLFQRFIITSFSVFLLEIGLLGTVLVFLLYWLVYRDAVVVAKKDPSLTGSIAVGWTGIVAVMTLSTFYVTTHAFSSLSDLYWYFSGIVAARRVQLQLAGARSPAAVPLRRSAVT
ncbi:MAG: hypothetical protein ACREVV_08760 [Steroidobacteraceae bacterium]